jgi:hypothetical protein
MKTYIYGIEQKTQPRTRIAYLGDNEVFFRFIKQVNPVYKNMEIVDFPLKMLDQITTEDIEEYEHYLKYYIDPETHCEIINNERAIKRKMSSLRSMYNFFYKNQSIETNPAMQIDMPKLHDKAIVRMDTEEVSRLLDVVETGETLSDAQKRFHNKNKLRDLTMISLLLGTGIRVSECVGLDIGDVDFKNCGIKIVRKGGYESIVYFSDEIKRQLEMYLKERNAIECERDVDDMKMAEYMEDHIGEEFEGVIDGIMNFGMFIQLPNLIEGLVKVESIKDDYYFFDEELNMLIGKNHKKKFKLGDKVKVKVIAASKDTSTIDFVLVG